ncbi:MAG: NIPSNAP family protein [Rhizobiaceae bacterium]|nr:NIPSNAP family protein [Rhizobiaceae bacterium]MCV0404923.1 NIPSNAP family protein [Rhizobiaceae bacterium]
MSLFEFRFYAVASGRMASELALVHDMAIAGAPDTEGGPPEHEQTLWERYGVPRPLGSWVTLSGAATPGFLYIMKWRDLGERDARFPRFWLDRFWRARRAQLTDGMTLVDSIENWVMEALPQWESLREQGQPTESGGVHELRVQDVLNGSQAEAADVLATIDLPALKRRGAKVMGLFEVAIGPGRPRFVILLAWPDLQTQIDGWLAFDRDVEVTAQRERERAKHGRRLFSTSQQHLLQPVKWNRPRTDFGAVS